MSHRVGRRGSVLLLLGSIYALYGVALTTAGASQPEGLALITGDVVSITAWGYVWLIVGLIAIVHAFRRGPGQDGPGFIALVLTPTVWVAANFWAWVLFLVGLGGFERGWISAAIWTAVAGLVVICAGWPEANGPMGGARR